MMESSRKSPTKNVIHSKTSILDPDINNSSSVIDSGKPTSMAHPCIAATATLPGSKHGKHSDDSSCNVGATVPSASDIKLSGNATSLPANGTTLAVTMPPAHVSPSLFAKLPGELRNRIYYAYLALIVGEKQKSADIRKAAPTYLNLMHTDHMIRCEFGSIFDKEYLCNNDSFVTGRDFEGDAYLRIQSTCALAAIRNIHSPISITCEKHKVSSPVTLSYEYARGEYRRRFGQQLSRFISNATSSRAQKIGRSFPPKQTEKHFPSIRKDIGIETRIGQYLIQFRHTLVSGKDQKLSETLRVSGPLAELHWPFCRWHTLSDGNKRVGLHKRS